MDKKCPPGNKKKSVKQDEKIKEEPCSTEEVKNTIQIHEGKNCIECSRCDFTTKFKHVLNKHIFEVHDRKNQDHDSSPFDEEKPDIKSEPIDEEDVMTDEEFAETFLDASEETDLPSDDNTAIEEETSETFEESEAFIDASLLCNVQINDNTDSAIGSSENLGVPGGSIQNLLKEQVLLPLPYLEKSGGTLAPPAPPFPLPLHPEKDFQCPICFKGFKLKPVLKRHMKEVHEKRKREEEKSYNCPICPQLFSAKAAVQRHITEIHGKYPFQCTLCPAKFALKGRFNRHLTVVHERKKLNKSNSHGAISETRVHDGNMRGFMPNINLLEPVPKETLKEFVKDEEEIKNVLPVPIIPVHEEKFQIKNEPIDEEDVMTDEEFSETFLDASEMCNVQIQNEEDGEIPENISVHEKEKPFSCDECGSRFAYKGNLTVHLKLHENIPKEFKCSICLKEFSKKFNLKDHISRVHEEKEKEFKCSICDKLFGAKSTLKRHIALVHEKNKPIQCSFCPTRFGFESEYKRHILIVHEKVKPFQCTFCPARFAYKGEFNNHVSVVHEGKELNTQDANTTLSEETSGTLDSSKVQKNENLGGKVLEKVLENVSKSAEKDFQCPICFKGFAVKGTLKRHISLVHEKNKPIQCPLCPTRFGVPSELKNHIAIVHEKEKPFQCIYCPARFSYRIEFKKHMGSCLLVHEGKELSTPNAFQKSYDTINGINNSHEDISEYPCPFCPLKFGSRDDFNSHYSVCLPNE